MQSRARLLGGLAALLLGAAAAGSTPVEAEPEAPLAAARRAVEEERFDEARTLLQASARSGDREALHWLGRAEFGLGHADAALDCFERGVEEEPLLVRSHFWYGRACNLKVNQVGKLFQLKWAKRMREAFDRAHELDPQDPEPLFALVRFHREAPGIAGGDRELAWRHARELARVDPALGEPILASMFQEDGDPGQAADAFGRAIAASPEEKALRYGFVATLADAGRAVESFAALDDLLRLQADDPLALYLVGRTAAISGLELERGRVALQAYLAQAPPPGGPPPAGAHWRLGTLLERAGDVEAARTAYRASLKLDPGFKPARESLKGLNDR